MSLPSSLALPAHPNLEWLRKTAKDRLGELRAASPDAQLSDAQLEVARQYGFASWRAMAERIESLGVDGQLIIAARNGDTASLAKLLDENPGKLYVIGGEWDQPLLHHAAKNGHLGCVNVLLDRGYNVNYRDKLDNATAMHFAAERGQTAIVQRLIEAGGDVHGDGDVHELGILGWATAMGQCHRETAELLMRHGPAANIFAAVALEMGDRVRQIAKENPIQIHRRGSRFEHLRTPLHFAVERDLPEMVQLLLELGADANARDSRGMAPITQATPRVSSQILELLQKAGANPADRTHNQFGSVTPILNVRDVPASIDYFVRKMGFRKLWDWGTPPTFACVGRDNVEIFLCQGEQGQPGTWMAIFLKDVDALHEEYKRSGAIICQPPTTFPWGMREMNVQDIDGHRFRMSMRASEPAEGIPLKET